MPTLTPILGVVALILAAVSGWLGASEQNLPAIVAGIAAGASLIGAALAWRALLGSAVAALLGAGVSAYLTVQHSAAGDSVCNIDQTFNCDLVNTSRFSEIGGVPIALLGFGFYVAIAVISALALQGSPKWQRAPALVYLGGIAAVLYSVFLAWASSTLGAWCLFCISSYVVNLLLLVSGWLATRGEPLNAWAAIGGKDGDVSFIGALGAGAAAAFLGSALFGGTGEPPIEGPQDLSRYYEAPEGTLTLTGSEPSYGKLEAPYTLVEFADYQCPYCARVFDETKALVEEHPEVRVLFKHYPLSSHCNPNVGNAMHEQACTAAIAATCAERQGRFWELSRLMFKNQQNLSRDDIDFMAVQQVGMDADAFGECMEDPAAKALVDRDIAAGAAAGIHSTPNFFLRGLHPSGDIRMSKALTGVSELLEARARGEELPEPPAAKPHGHAH